jgi:hypothetical protein
MYTSFISEHTAELILVPKLLNVLTKKYRHITPLYYWASREGGAMSNASFHNKSIKVIAMYPRRPKVKFPGAGIIQIKFNQLLFDRSSYLTSHGIPVLAGIPLADSLESIHSGTACNWFYLNPDGVEEIGILHLQNSNHFSSDNVRIINEEEIFELIESKAVVCTWPDTLLKIKEMRRIQTESFRRWSGISGDLYKPIYFVLQIN